MDSARCQKGHGSPFWQPPANTPARRTQAASGRPFLWILSFGRAKESIPPSGAETRLKNVAIATQKNLHSFTHRNDLTPSSYLRCRYLPQNCINQLGQKLFFAIGIHRIQKQPVRHAYRE